MGYVSVYDGQMRLLAVLENADAIGYELKYNDLWTAQFSLPAWDDKNEFCAMHNFVRLPGDGGRDLGVYRIVGMPDADETGLAGMRTYSLEHAMATLLDDVMFEVTDWTQGDGIEIGDAVASIIGRQTARRWELGRCDFDGYIQHRIENMSLLEALRSLESWLPADGFAWVWDTSAEPWTVSLVRSEAEPGCGILYRRNLAEIRKSIDASALVTRIWPLGHSDGNGQLTIRDVNGGIPYLDADTQAAWGVRSGIWADTSITDAGMLAACAHAQLEGMKNPRISYTAKAVDLAAMTGDPWDRFMPGKLVRVTDTEHGIDFDARILAISKRDLLGDPGSVEITISNALRDSVDGMVALANRVNAMMVRG